jgi:hypothetical protein
VVQWRKQPVALANSKRKEYDAKTRYTPRRALGFKKLAAANVLLHIAHLNKKSFGPQIAKTTPVKHSHHPYSWTLLAR